MTAKNDIFYVLLWSVKKTFEPKCSISEEWRNINMDCMCQFWNGIIEAINGIFYRLIKNYTRIDINFKTIVLLISR